MKTATILIRDGWRREGFTTRNKITLDYWSDYASIIWNKYEDAIMTWEIKIIFPTKIVGTSSWGSEWVVEQLLIENNWDTTWACYTCSESFPDLSNTLKQEQMDILKERFPWTCPNCYNKKIKNHYSMWCRIMKWDLLDSIVAPLFYSMDDHNDAIFRLAKTDIFPAIDLLDKYPVKKNTTNSHIIPNDIDLDILYEELMVLALDELERRIKILLVTNEVLVPNNFYLNIYSISRRDIKNLIN